RIRRTVKHRDLCLSIEDRDEIGKFPLSHLLKMFVLVGGITRPEFLGAPQIGGMLIGAIGAVLALWCLLAFAFIGKGTPAPFDPPRRLVIRGPYRFVRNPMYIGAATALAGTALFYQSWSLLVFTGLFLLATHLFVISYEEPTLRRTFGEEYEAYCVQVNRWLVRSSPSCSP